MRTPMRFAGMLALAGLALAPGPAYGQDRYVGRPLVEVLREFQTGGLAIVYSSALVTPAMIVETEPTATAPREILSEILAPLGLGLHEGPTGQLVVVRHTAAGFTPDTTGTIGGAIEADASISPLAGVRVRIEELGVETQTDARGRFLLTMVPIGEYAVETMSPAFLPARLERVRVRAGEVTTLRIPLAPAVGFLEHVTVTPSHFRLFQEEPASRQFLSREEIARMPHLADDVYRAVTTLPGTSGGDFSAQFHVRGGCGDETLVLLDGLELYEPFHLKDFQNLFSAVDAAAIGGVEFLTGGFPVEYGDRMSGVMDMSVVTPTGSPATSVGVSTLNGHILSTGSFNADRGHWLVSGRGWYPAAVAEAADLVNDEIVSDYYDVLAKVEHRIGVHSSLSGDVLVAYDRIGFSAEDAEESEQIQARYASHHLWFNLRTDWSPTIASQTVVAVGKLRRERSGSVVDVEEGTLEVDDDRTFTFVGFRQDWTAALGTRQMLKWGIDYKLQEASYVYDRDSRPDTMGAGALQLERPADARVLLQPEGESFATYLADRVRIADHLVTEVGLRWDRQSWLDESQLSPRFNLLWEVGRTTALRVAWGRFHQSQRLNELQVEDGVAEFFEAQTADHLLVSVEHGFHSGVALRLEAYRKTLEDLRPRYENLFNPLELFPEARDDRILIAADGGRLQGIEAVLKGRGDGRLAWWLTYGLALAEDRVAGEPIPRAWDQRHAAGFGVNLGLPRRWDVSLAGTFHSGWPTTAVTGDVVEVEGEPQVELRYGPRNRDRLPPYFRLDLRATRSFPVSSGTLTLVLDILNLTNRENVCCVDDFTTAINDDGTVEVTRKYRHWAPIVPSIGIRFQH